MDLPRLQELKRKLIQDKELAPIWTYFLDHFGEDQDFIDLGEPAEEPFVEHAIAQVGMQLFGRDGVVHDLLLTRIAEERFLHGAFTMGVRLGGVFFFEDNGKGLIAVTDRPPATGAKFARFTGHPIPKPGEPSPN